MAFQNPIKTSTSAPSGGTVVPDVSTTRGDSIATIATVAAAGYKMFQANEAEAAQTAVQDRALSLIREYNVIREEKGAAAAERIVNTKYLDEMQGMSQAGRELFQTTFKDNFGDAPSKALRSRDDAVLDQEAKAQAEQQRQLMEVGRLMYTGAGVDPETISPEQLARAGETYNAKVANIELQAKQTSLQAAKMGVTANERTLTSQKAFGNFAAQLETMVGEGVTELNRQIKQDPTQAPELQAKQLAELSRLETTLRNEAGGFLRSVGGDISDIRDAEIAGLQNYIKGTKDLILSNHVTEMNQARFAQFESGVQVELMKQHPEIAGLMVGSKFSGLQVTLPEYQQVGRQVADGMLLGPSSPTITDENARKTAQKVIGDSLSVANGFNEDTRPEYVQKSADMVIDNLLDAQSPRGTVRKNALGKNGIRHMLEQIAVNDVTPEAMSALEDRAAQEGTSVTDMMQVYVSGFITDTLLPSLDAPAGLDTQGVPYTAEFDNGLIRLNSQPRTGQSTSEFAGVANAFYNQNYRRRLKQMEKELNTTIRAYTKMTGGNPSDLSEVILQALRVSQEIEGQ